MWRTSPEYPKWDYQPLSILGPMEQSYGKKFAAKQIVLSEEVEAPPAAEQLVSTLDAKIPHHNDNC